MLVKMHNIKKKRFPVFFFFFVSLVFLIIGIKESAVLNNVFTFVNLSVIALVIVVGLTKIQGHNWNISPNEVKMIDDS